MKFLEITFDKKNLIFFCKNKSSLTLDNCSIVICDAELECPYYAWNNITINDGFDCWMTPFAEKLKNIVLNNHNFHGFLLKVYGPNNRLIQSETFYINNAPPTILDTFSTPTHDDVGASYVDFFFGDLCNNIDTNGVIIDAGANVGFFTLFCKKNGASRIYAIEPDPSPFNHLKYNFKSDNSIICINKALTTHTNEINFEICLKNSVASSINAYKIESDNKLIITTNSINLETILSIENEVNLVKLDIEGEEFNVIESLPNICFDKINQFFIEFHNYPNKIFEKLNSFGYICEYKHCDENSQVGFIYAKKY